MPPPLRYNTVMYIPQQVGIPAEARPGVIYDETAPPDEYRELLYCTWELRTTMPLESDFMYLVLPDICTDIIFDLDGSSSEGLFIMRSGNRAEEINLGKDFHFVGIRFLPGVVANEYMQNKAHASDLQRMCRQLQAADTEGARRLILLECVAALLAQASVTKNYLMHQVVAHSQELHTVGDIEALTGYTRRQLQRIFRRQTSLSPRDFLKVLRFQQALSSGASDMYADQSHLIKEFKRVTGLTPTGFKAKY